MKEFTLIFVCLLLLSITGQAQSGGANNWLSFVVQAEGRPGGTSTSWERVQRLEVSKRVGQAAGQDNTAGLIRFNPQDKEVRFTFSNFTINGAWFLPSEISVEYQEDGRNIGPIKALPGAGNSDYFQMTLRFREKTDRSLLSVRLIGRVSGQFVKDTVNTLLMWGSGETAPANIQVSYLDNYNNGLTAKSPYTDGAPASYGANQGRIETSTRAFAIQLGAYTVLPDSRQFSAAAPYGQVYSRRIGGLDYVRVGPYNDAAQAQQFLQRIRASFPEAYIVMEEPVPQASAAPTVAPFTTTSPYGQPSQYGAVANSSRLPATNTLTIKGETASSYILPASITGYAIQLASYKKEENAAEVVDRLKQKGLSDLYVWKKDGNNRVVIAPFPNKKDASNYLTTLKSQYAQEGIVVYIDSQ
ncbi:MAG: SPOR domain-containing protein [Phaeodactylibacter sp.]|nr:SPOR domain-containing protein [Phaeodactylibacter sp.]